MNTKLVETYIVGLDRQTGAQAKACADAMADWYHGGGGFGTSKPCIIQDARGQHIYGGRDYVFSDEPDLIADLDREDPFDGLEPVSEEAIRGNAWAWTAQRWLGAPDRRFDKSATLPGQLCTINTAAMQDAIGAVDDWTRDQRRENTMKLMPVFARQGDRIIYCDREALNSAKRGHCLLAFEAVARQSAEEAAACIYLLFEAAKIEEKSVFENLNNPRR